MNLNVPIFFTKYRFSEPSTLCTTGSRKKSFACGVLTGYSHFNAHLFFLRCFVVILILPKYTTKSNLELYGKFHSQFQMTNTLDYMFHVIDYGRLVSQTRVYEMQLLSTSPFAWSAGSLRTAQFVRIARDPMICPFMICIARSASCILRSKDNVPNYFRSNKSHQLTKLCVKKSFSLG